MSVLDQCRKQSGMTQKRRWQLVLLTVWWISAGSVVDAASGLQQATLQLLPGNRVVFGTVVEVRSNQAKITTSGGQPRYVPMNVRKYKRLPELKKADLVEITLNDQNLLVDVHKAGESRHHQVVRGQLAGPLVTGHDKAMLRTARGVEQCHLIRPVARSKVASIPIGAEAIFLIDELDKIVDVTMESVDAVHRAAELRLLKSPLKGNLTQVLGEILKPVKDNRIVIRTEAGTEHSYEVCPLIQVRVETLSEGDVAVFLVNDDNKVADIAFVPE